MQPKTQYFCFRVFIGFCFCLFFIPSLHFLYPVYISQKATDSQKKQFITVLNSKRSNAINIGLTVLPQPETIKQAVLHMDSLVLTKENVEVKRKQEDGLVNTQVQDVFLGKNPFGFDKIARKVTQNKL